MAGVLLCHGFNLQNLPYIVELDCHPGSIEAKIAFQVGVCDRLLPCLSLSLSVSLIVSLFLSLCLCLCVMSSLSVSLCLSVCLCLSLSL